MEVRKKFWTKLIIPPFPECGSKGLSVMITRALSTATGSKVVMNGVKLSLKLPKSVYNDINFG
jgi:hypothetical protein